MGNKIERLKKLAAKQKAEAVKNLEVKAARGQLEIGAAYMCDRAVPVVPNPEPKDYVKAVIIKRLAGKKPFTVTGVKWVRSKPWYDTEYGFINAIALQGSGLRKV